FIKPDRPEDAASLRRGLNATGPNAPRGVQAASDWIMGELAETGALRANGTLNAAGIDAFERSLGGVLDAFPEARAALRTAAAQARKGELSAETFAERVRAATRNLRDTEAELNTGAFRAVLGKDPEHAVAGIFGSG